MRAYGSQYDNYAHGELLSDGLPQDGDLSFQLGYTYNLASMAQDLLSWLRQAWLLLPLLLVLWLPGNLLLTALLGRDHKFARLDAWQRFALSLGLSLASLPLFLLWTTTLGAHLNRTWVFVLFGFLLALKTWQLRQPFMDRLRTGRRTTIQLDWDAIAILLILLFSLGIRLAMTRDLATPAWVDSVHHATLVRLILEQGAFPASYQPLIPAATASYHVGYHAVMACFTWLSRFGIAAGYAHLWAGAQRLERGCGLSLHAQPDHKPQSSPAGGFNLRRFYTYAGLPGQLGTLYTSDRHADPTGSLYLPGSLFSGPRCRCIRGGNTQFIQR